MPLISVASFKSKSIPNAPIAPKYVLNNPNVHGDSTQDRFGCAVALSPTYAAVAAYVEEDANYDGSGKVYLFDVGTSTLIRTLTNPNPYGTSYNDGFGRIVAISGTRIIVGALENDASGTASGKVYVFDIDTGALLHTLNNPNAYSTSKDDWFGLSGDIANNHIVIGAQFEDSAGASSAGKAYVFDATTGALLHTLSNPNAYGTAAGDRFGTYIAASNGLCVVGVPLEGDANGTFSGKAYVFDLNTGSLLRTLNNPNAYGTAASDGFGSSVAISEDYILVSATSEDDAAGTGSGKVYVFDVSTGALLRTLDNPNAYGTSLNDSFGITISLNGDLAVVASHEDDSATGTDSGKVYIFNVVTGVLLHTINNPNPYGTSTYDYFGSSVALYGDYFLVGATGEDDEGGSTSGKAYLFQL